jgi:hypothetical protein
MRLIFLITALLLAIASDAGAQDLLPASNASEIHLLAANAKPELALKNDDGNVEFMIYMNNSPSDTYFQRLSIRQAVYKPGSSRPSRIHNLFLYKLEGSGIWLTRDTTKSHLVEKAYNAMLKNKK